MKELTGSEKQIAWATKIRAEKLEWITRCLEIDNEGLQRELLRNPPCPRRTPNYQARIAKNEKALEFFSTATSAKAIIDQRDYAANKA